MNKPILLFPVLCILATSCVTRVESSGKTVVESVDVSVPGDSPITLASNNMKTIEGDLIKLAQEGVFDVIVHGCNCFCTMGAGIAKEIKAAFPQAFKADSTTGKGDKNKLGTCTTASEKTHSGEVIIINAYTQYHWRGRGIKADYEAIRSCFKWIRENYGNKRIGFPMIGGGLAGGDWEVISEIIEEELSGCDITLVKYKP